VPDFVREGLAVVDEVAVRLAAQLGVARDDLRSIGHEALGLLLDRFDPRRSPLEAYLRARLRWAMLDGIRRESHGRAVAARARALEGSLAVSESGETPSGETPSGALPTIEQHHARLRGLLGAHATALATALAARGGSVDSSKNPEKDAARRQAAGALCEAIATLDPRRRTVLERHYFAGEPLGVVARELGVSKPQCSRLHTEAIALLQLRLRGTAADPRT
jgi:RNA polymerase sigma factor for flagellar operon FliA